MKLTTKSEYSLLALIYIARHEKNGYIRIEEICDHYKIPAKYLEHLMTTMKQNRVVKSRRGMGGGYQLGRPARDIRIAEVIRLMDGALAPTESVSTYYYAHTPLEQEQKIMDVFQDIRNYVARKLERLRLSDLV